MPILRVEIVTRSGQAIRPGIAQELADRTAEIFGSESGGTWVSVHLQDRDFYAKNDSAVGGIFPVFVSALKAKLPSPEALQMEITRLAEAVAHICDRPKENVHIPYQPKGAGRVAFGGRLVESFQRATAMVIFQNQAQALESGLLVNEP